MKVRIDNVLDYVIDASRKTPCIEQVKLFGSRARGNFHQTSDYDLAFYTAGMSLADWARFSVELEENKPTLLEFDLVQMSDTMNPELRNRIETEGISLLPVSPE